MDIVRLGCYTSSPLFSLSVNIRHNFSPPVFGPNCVPERNHLSRLPRVVVVPFQCCCCCFDSYHHLLGSLVFFPSYIFVFTTMIDDTRPPIAFFLLLSPQKNFHCNLTRECFPNYVFSEYQKSTWGNLFDTEGGSTLTPEISWDCSKVK